MDMYTENILLSSGKFDHEWEYWLHRLQSCSGPSSFPVDAAAWKNGNALYLEEYVYEFPNKLTFRLKQICSHAKPAMYMILLTGVLYLLNRYSQEQDLLVGVPRLLSRDGSEKKQASSSRLLAMRHTFMPEESLKSSIGFIQSALGEIYQHPHYPLARVFEQLGLPLYQGSPYLRVLASMEEVHEQLPEYVVPGCVHFHFAQSGRRLKLRVVYDGIRIAKQAVHRMARLLQEYYLKALAEPSSAFREFELLPEEEWSVLRSTLSPAEETFSAAGKAVSTGHELEYTAPRNEQEAELQKHWSDVLGVEKVGIHHNFFSLGGDSIKAIRLAAALWKYNMRVKDLYAYPSIAELVEHGLREVPLSISQEAVTGRVALTPIQRWFFSQDVNAYSSPLDQYVMVYRHQGFDPRIVSEVWICLMQHHDALRMIYSEEDGAVLQRIQDTGHSDFGLTVLDYTKQTITAEQLSAAVGSSRRSLDYRKGRLAHLTLFQTADGSHMLLNLHHLIVDGISWRILLGDFAVAYRQLLSREKIALPPKTHSYQEWADRIEWYSTGEEVAAEAPYWLRVLATDTDPLPGANRMKQPESGASAVARQPISFTREETELLKQESNRLHLGMESYLLAAVATALWQWAGIRNIRVDLEGHGRQDVLEDMNVNRTVGWFTAIYPVVLQAGAGTFLDEVRQIQDMLDHVPRKGFGYGILRYLAPQLLGAYADVPNSPLCFNYLGELDQDLDTQMFTLSSLSAGDSLEDGAAATYALAINCAINDNRLRVNLSSTAMGEDPDNLAELAEIYQRILGGYLAAARKARTEEGIEAKVRRLKGIQPFNNVFYKDCFYNALFAAAGYFGICIEPFLANDAFCYSPREERLPLYIQTESRSHEDIFRLIKHCGIEYVVTEVSRDIIKDIEWAITGGRPAVVRIDCYYESCRKDTYRKKHWPHTLLVTGFDQRLRQFYILEHTNIDSLDYAEQTISYEELVECYNGLLEHFRVTEDFPSFISFWADIAQAPTAEAAPPWQRLSAVMQIHRNEVLGSLTRTGEFVQELASILQNEASLTAQVEPITASFSEMIRQKYMEAYRISRLLPEDFGGAGQLQEMISVIKLIKSVVDKFRFSGKYRPESLEKGRLLLQRLPELESSYYAELYAWFDRNSLLQASAGEGADA
jgi:non-ribosomal peptide synthase protein (TIGR01720 family)